MPTYSMEKRDALADDVEVLLSAGETTESILQRTGYATSASLCKRLARHGRYDLTRQLGWFVSRPNTLQAVVIAPPPVRPVRRRKRGRTMILTLAQADHAFIREQIRNAMRRGDEWEVSRLERLLAEPLRSASCLAIR